MYAMRQMRSGDKKRNVQRVHKKIQRMQLRKKEVSLTSCFSGFIWVYIE